MLFCGINIHSDTCPADHDFDKIDAEYRGYLHTLLDEWLDKSGGTGIFYIREEGLPAPVDQPLKKKSGTIN